jgi:predicted Zn-dependent protease
MDGFKALTDQEKIGRKPYRIAIKQVNNSITLRDALKSYDIPDARLEEFSIVNGMALTDKWLRER